MAQYRLSVSIASRGKGRSAVAMAAYRSGEALDDERTGERFDFTRKRGIVYSQIVLPTDAPEWAQDRAVFWNRSEAADKRADAQIAREIQLSLPHELNDRQRRELTQGFSQHIAERYGIAVDTCIHHPHDQGDDRNHHAHLLLCTRPFDDQKKTGFGNKVRALDNIARQRQQQPTENDIEQLRENWAQRLNDALKRADIQTAEGVSVQLDHRSYERQGIDQEPTVKEGPAATGLKRRGQSSERVEINDEIRERNTQRGQLKNQVSAAARELETLKKSIQQEDDKTPSDGIFSPNMTEKDRQTLEEQSGVAHLQNVFALYKRRLEHHEKLGEDIPPNDLWFAEPDTLQNQLKRAASLHSQEHKDFDRFINDQLFHLREDDAGETLAAMERYNAQLEATPDDWKKMVDHYEQKHGEFQRARDDEEIKIREQFAAYQEGRYRAHLVGLSERFENPIDDAVRELETLKKSIEAGEADTPIKGKRVSTMNKYELERLEEKAKIPEFRENFDAYMEQQILNDQQQMIGRSYDHNFDVNREVNEQYEEKAQRQDQDHMQDDARLRLQDKDERLEFDKWLKQQRDDLRADDFIKTPDKLEPRLTPNGVERTPSQGVPSAPLKDIEERENLRRKEADLMREKFDTFQKNRVEEREQKLTNRLFENTERLDNAFDKENQRRELEKSLTTKRQSADRNTNDLRKDLTPAEETGGIKLKKGETEQQAKDRIERMEKARKEREEAERKDPNRNNKDDWNPR